MTIQRPPPVVFVVERRFRTPWVLRLVLLLFALLVLPVLIALNLLLYAVILPALVQTIIG
jgi:hypothetical protein